MHNDALPVRHASRNAATTLSALHAALRGERKQRHSLGYSYDCHKWKSLPLKLPVYFAVTRRSTLSPPLFNFSSNSKFHNIAILRTTLQL